MERDPSPLDATPAPTALFAWGANSYGQLGLGHKEDVLLPQQLNDFCKPVCVRRITGGGGHSAVVTGSPKPLCIADEGSLFVCGLNKDGQLGLGHTEDVLCFTPCKSLLRCPIQQVACGWDFTIILTESGQVLSCGSNSFGQLGIPHGPRRCLVPQAIELLREKVVSVAAGLRHALAATGLENSKAIRVAAGSEHSASLTDLSSGVVRYVTVGTAAEFNFATVYDPHVEGSLCLQKDGLDLLRRASSFQLVKLRLGEEAIVQDAGELYVWGSGKHGQLASQAAFLPVPQEIEAHCFQSEKVTAVWSGWTHLVAQTETGKVFTWGRADYGQLGRKPESPEGWKPERQGSPLCCSRPQKSTPSSLHCLTGATEVSCGSEHNLAVVGGVCRSWGWNEHGMCGDGSEAHVWAPKPVQALRSSSVLLVGCGAGHSLALCQLPALPPPGASEDAGSQEATERRQVLPTPTRSPRCRNGGLTTETL